jgi:hypothetical protein
MSGIEWEFSACVAGAQTEKNRTKAEPAQDVHLGLESDSVHLFDQESPNVEQA